MRLCGANRPRTIIRCGAGATVPAASAGSRSLPSSAPFSIVSSRGGRSGANSAASFSLPATTAAKRRSDQRVMVVNHRRFSQACRGV